MHDRDRVRAAMDLFKRACVLEPLARPGFLDEQCRGDEDLRQRVLTLLEEDSRSLNPVDVPGGGVPMLARQIAALTSSTAPLGDRATVDATAIPILTGDYRIIRIIGEGGMGVVYEAEQSLPRRRVALKAIRPGLSSPELVRRFTHEAHILGRLHHPGIAQIYEAGAAASDLPGQAFIAMEFVAGPTLTEHADAAALAPRARIALMVKVCAAVQHAHQRGIIHRDLKPTNILVAPDGQPKVLDFGVARALDADDSGLTTMHTAAGQLVGTIAYMSPEQVGGDPSDVDVQSDVYALGVVLFRMLAGVLPYDFARRSVPEMARIIQSEPPLRLASVNPALRGDLDTIVAKAIEKDRTRRYQSVHELEADLRAYLEGAPIEARRDSALYVLQKQLGRYKFAATASIIVVLIAIGASVALTSLYHEARHQAQVAADATQLARAAEAEQRAAAEHARVEARRAQRVSQFLQRTFRSADPRVAQGRDRTILEALEEASQRVGRELADDPPVQAAVHDSIGATFLGLGLYPQAEQHFAAAAKLYESLGDAYTAEHATALIHRAKMIQLDPARLDEALASALQARALLQPKYGDHHPALSLVLATLGTLQRLRGNLDEAEASLRHALAIRRDFPETDDEDSSLMAAISGLVNVLVKREKWHEAEPLAREALEVGLARLGPNHPNIPLAMNNLAAVLEHTGGTDEAETLYRQAVESVQRINGPDHVTVSMAESNLAKVLTGRGAYDEAGALYEDVIRIRREKFGAEHPQVAIAMSYYGKLLTVAGRAAEAAPVLRKSVEMLRAYPGVGPVEIGSAEIALGSCEMALDHLDAAEPLLLSGYRRVAEAAGDKHPVALDGRSELVKLYERQGNADGAAVWRQATAP